MSVRFEFQISILWRLGKKCCAFERSEYVPVGVCAGGVQCVHLLSSESNTGSNMHKQNLLREWIMITGSPENMLQCRPIEQMDIRDWRCCFSRELSPELSYSGGWRLLHLIVHLSNRAAFPYSGFPMKTRLKLGIHAVVTFCVCRQVYRIICFIFHVLTSLSTRQTVVRRVFTSWMLSTELKLCWLKKWNRSNSSPFVDFCSKHCFTSG